MPPTTIEYGYLELPYLEAPYLSGAIAFGVNSQVLAVISNYPKILRSQVGLSVTNSLKVVRSQVKGKIEGNTKFVHSQARRIIAAYPKTVLEQAKLQIAGNLKPMHQQVRRGGLFHETCTDAGYLQLNYLTGPYLGEYFCVHLRSQVRLLQGKTLRTQVRLVLYNITNLRVLADFPSRGLTGINWTSTSTAPGDFNQVNLNTDIVEQVWRSNGTTSATITCDTEVAQGVFVDTMGILGHNLTTSASVVFQGSNDGFITAPFTTTLQMELRNSYYIAPTLPAQSFRYWRLIISDTTNTDGYLQIGTIVFGSAVIFQGECFTDEVRKSTLHFSDKITTEGYTNVSNDRALKYGLGLDFRFLNYNQGNYTRLRAVFDEARTSHKCLWIPTPQYPSRFALFGKMPQIPDETHRDFGATNDYVSFPISVDESL